MTEYRQFVSRKMAEMRGSHMTQVQKMKAIGAEWRVMKGQTARVHSGTGVRKHKKGGILPLAAVAIPAIASVLPSIISWIRGTGVRGRGGRPSSLTSNRLPVGGRMRKAKKHIY